MPRGVRTRLALPGADQRVPPPPPVGKGFCIGGPVRHDFCAPGGGKKRFALSGRFDAMPCPTWRKYRAPAHRATSPCNTARRTAQTTVHHTRANLLAWSCTWLGLLCAGLAWLVLHRAGLVLRMAELVVHRAWFVLRRAGFVRHKAA